MHRPSGVLHWQRTWLQISPRQRHDQAQVLLGLDPYGARTVGPLDGNFFTKSWVDRQRDLRAGPRRCRSEFPKFRREFTERLTANGE